MSATGLELRDVALSFGDTPVLDSVTLDLAPGRIATILGPSGSGKSTLLSVLIGSLPPARGQVLLDGRPLTARAEAFAFMPQHDALLPWRRIIDNAAIGLQIAGLGRREARSRAGELFDVFGIAGTERLYPRQLSGGMRQRVSLLRTVVQGRPILLLDEPFGALDAITRHAMQQWLLGMWGTHGWSILLITHDIREAVMLSDDVYVFSPRPARVIEAVTIDRDIPRDPSGGVDPRVPALEARLHRALSVPPDRAP